MIRNKFKLRLKVKSLTFNFQGFIWESRINYRALTGRTGCSFEDCLNTTAQQAEVKKLLLINELPEADCINNWEYNDDYKGFFFEIKYGDCNMKNTRESKFNEETETDEDFIQFKDRVKLKQFPLLYLEKNLVSIFYHLIRST